MCLCAILLAALLGSWAAAQIDLQLAPGNHCEEPSLVKGHLHIVIASFARDTCFDTWLWDLGTTNADVTVYRRLHPELPERSWAGPCGMSVKERVLFPNHGKDGAVFYDFVSEHYNNMPPYMAFVHGHGPGGKTAWHTSCEATISRVRLYYRLLATPVLGLTEEEHEMLHHSITLSSHRNGSGLYNGDLRRLLEAPPSEEENKPTKEMCNNMFTKYNVARLTNNWKKSFGSCCASFMAPTAKLLRLPKLFYKDMRSVALAVANDHITTRTCFEFRIWSLFDEPQLDDATTWFYKAAAEQVEHLNLDRCKENKCQVGLTE